MTGLFGTRFLSKIAGKMSKEKETMSSEAADEALALELQDEEIASVLQFYELNLDSPPRSPQWHHHASSSATTGNSRAADPASVIATEHAFGINLFAAAIVTKVCDICTETKPRSSFISTNACTHQYCTDCCKLHAEAKLSSGTSEIPCPFATCAHTFSISQLHSLLSPQSFAILNTRLTESAIPAALKVYCPFADCSAQMERVSSEEKRPGHDHEAFAECCSCHRGFCQECRVAWHSGKTCGEWRAEERNGKLAGDQKLRELATRQKWQQCAECARMIELTRGCHHITCLCGNEFCYVCGARWRNRAATCKCKLWDESRIVGN